MKEKRNKYNWYLMWGFWASEHQTEEEPRWQWVHLQRLQVLPQQKLESFHHQTADPMVHFPGTPQPIIRYNK